METLAKLRPAFQKDGTVTAGNACGINDGAAALVLASAEAAEAAGLKPRARLLGYGHTLRYLRAARAAITCRQPFFPTCYGTELTSDAILKWQEERRA